MENDYENIFLEEENCADALSDIPDDYDHSDTGDSASESGFDNSFSTRHSPRVYSDFEHDVESDWNDDDPPRNNLSFEGNPGLPFNLDKKNIDDIVSLFFEDYLLQIISSETNRYYHQNSNASKLPKKTKKWYDVTAPELKIWLGVIIIMGLEKKSKLSDYWSTNQFQPIIEGADNY
ncbi:uncharacterized protein LOC128855933 [Anastrepha ludens]|uniref:uncharacterized protein LOC128855933 n=1 Tax=Anastrepha ludens TaxID=28586 RepID=UPI0023B0A805|nr:uncharacterized protein LOC128855933 [Anastrepha ludens]